jgi:antitoxin HigA-1
MSKARKKVFAVHAGEILKSEFMDPMGITAYELSKTLNFPGIYEVVRGKRSISADTAIRLGKYFGLPAQFWLNLQNDYDLRLAEGGGAGKGVHPRQIDRRPSLTGTR